MILNFKASCKAGVIQKSSSNFGSEKGRRRSPLPQLVMSQIVIQNIDASCLDYCCASKFLNSRFLTSIHSRHSENVTKQIENILMRLGRRLHENKLRQIHKMETRSTWQNLRGASKDENRSETGLIVFSAMWQCYIISTKKWKHSIKDVHSALLNTQPVSLLCNSSLKLFLFGYVDFCFFRTCLLD